MAVHTARGIDCPICKAKKSTEFVAMLPNVVRGRVQQPHEYAVCRKCYVEQWKVYYGEIRGKPDIAEQCPAMELPSVLKRG